MSALANTKLTTTAVGNREELSDVVSRITPEDTPIYSDIGKGSCVSVHPEWETDELRAPGDNIQTEGDEYAFNAITPPQRLGNYTQIFRDGFIISRTQETVDEAGKSSEGEAGCDSLAGEVEGAVERHQAASTSACQTSAASLSS